MEYVILFALVVAVIYLIHRDFEVQQELSKLQQQDENLQRAGLALCEVVRGRE